MSAIAVFEVPAIIGFPARILVLSASIFTSTNPPTGLPNYGIAGAYGAVMLLAGLILAYFYVRLVQHAVLAGNQADLARAGRFRFIR